MNSRVRESQQIIFDLFHVTNRDGDDTITNARDFAAKIHKGKHISPEKIFEEFYCNIINKIKQAILDVEKDSELADHSTKRTVLDPLRLDEQSPEPISGVGLAFSDLINIYELCKNAIDANATRVAIKIEHDGTNLIITVSDDGKPFPDFKKFTEDKITELEEKLAKIIPDSSIRNELIRVYKLNEQISTQVDLATSQQHILHAADISDTDKTKFVDVLKKRTLMEQNTNNYLKLSTEEMQLLVKFYNLSDEAQKILTDTSKIPEPLNQEEQKFLQHNISRQSRTILEPLIECYLNLDKRLENEKKLPSSERQKPPELAQTPYIRKPGAQNIKPREAQPVNAQEVRTGGGNIGLNDLSEVCNRNNGSCQIVRGIPTLHGEKLSNSGKALVFKTPIMLPANQAVLTRADLHASRESSLKEAGSSSFSADSNPVLASLTAADSNSTNVSVSPVGSKLAARRLQKRLDELKKREEQASETLKTPTSSPPQQNYPGVKIPDEGLFPILTNVSKPTSSDTKSQPDLPPLPAIPPERPSITKK